LAPCRHCFVPCLSLTGCLVATHLDVCGAEVGQRVCLPLDVVGVAGGVVGVAVDSQGVALRLLVDRRDHLGRTRTDVISRLRHLLLELVPGGAKKFLSASQARALLNTVRPRDVVGRTRRQLASELIGELTVIDKKIKAANGQLTELVEATGSDLLGLTGIGPSGAARLIGDVGDIHRFASRGHFASWNGTAPIDASSGDQQRHRLSRAENRRINPVLHIMAVVQLRNDTEGRAYYRRKLAAGAHPDARGQPGGPRTDLGLAVGGFGSVPVRW
jgi:transposase